MIAQPRQRFFGGRCGGPGRYKWTSDHDYRQVQRTRCFDLRNGGATARVLRHNDLNAMLAKELDVALHCERTRRLKDGYIRQLRGRGWFIDDANEVSVVRRGFEVGKCKTPNCTEDVPRIRSDRLHSGGNGGRFDPIVAVPLHPRGSFDSQKWRPRDLTSFNRVAAHLTCEGMRCVDHEIDPILEQEAGETVHTSEAACSNREGLKARLSSAAGQRQDGFEARIGRKRTCQGARFRRPPEKEDAHGARC
jgi:hypothetical protein